MNARVTDGMSSPGSIAILSDRFRSRATVLKDGTLRCKVTPLSGLTKFDYAHSKWLFPKSLWLIVFVVANIKRKTWLWLAPVAILLLGGKWFEHKYYPAPASSSAHGSIMLDEMLIVLLGLLLLALYSLFCVSRWHAAEHMAIAAYWKDGSTSLEAIAGEQRVNAACGGRYLLPILTVWFLATFVLGRHMPWLAAQAIGLEVMLWADKLWGFDRIPVFAQVNRLLQRFITTQPPGDLQMRTAQLAIERLIAAHAADN